MNPPCPVCSSPRTHHFQTIGQRCYWRCERCQATYLDPGQLPDLATEKAEYDRHQNTPEDAGYRNFLGRLATPLIERLQPGNSGLDYGCGPGPVLARMLEQAGFRVSLYDPIYAPDRAALKAQYDFITCTEVAEHFHQPAGEFERLFGLLKPGGWLGLMTRFQTDDTRFANWHYRRDPTHVVFYRESTIHWLAEKYGMRAELIPPEVGLLQKES